MHVSQHVAIKLRQIANPPSSMPILAWRHSQNLRSTSESKCGEYMKIFCEILSLPQDIVMDLNNVMCFEDVFFVYYECAFCVC
jgi:hypothetical protein